MWHQSLLRQDDLARTFGTLSERNRMSDYSFDGLIGKIQRFDPFESKYVIPRTVEIWTPPGYSENPSQRFKVLYMHDGENIFDSSSSKWSHIDWGIDETVTRLMTEDKIQPTLVVGIW